MLVIPKNEANVISSNISEIEEGIDIYSSLNTYNSNSLVQLGENIWECQKDNTTDIQPSFKIPLVWIYRGKTNYKRMFDPTSSSVTKNQNTIVYKFETSDVNTLALFNIKAKEVRVIVRDKDGNIKKELSEVTYTRKARDWWAWTYSKKSYIKSVSFRGLPMLLEGSLEVIIDNTGDIAQCGHLVYGQSIDLGMTLWDEEPTVRLRNTISKEKDENGIVNTKNNKTYKEITAKVLIDSRAVDDVVEILKDLSTTYCLWMADESEQGHRSLMDFGLYKDLDLPIGINVSFYNLEIDGVI